jgi:hypothetical protein
MYSRNLWKTGEVSGKKGETCEKYDIVDGVPTCLIWGKWPKKHDCRTFIPNESFCGA